ncbi:MAG TPA: hypothetical protein ENF75_06005 [Acidilobales archaeon]|nr:MAG: hypothetical protein DRO18_06260 [Thermoprotei archaeon]HDD26624.1 hypothetical protein [Acidilobales archaeon]
MNEVVFLIKPKGEYAKFCEKVKRKYFEYLSKGVTKFRFLVVSDDPLHRWIESVRCVLEINIAATIIVNQVRSEELGEVVQGLKNVEEIS